MSVESKVKIADYEVEFSHSMGGRPNISLILTVQGVIDFDRETVMDAMISLQTTDASVIERFVQASQENRFLTLSLE
jgi:hypothetical protein